MGPNSWNKTSALSPDLLDFLSGSLQTYQRRLVKALMDWRMDYFQRAPQGEEPVPGEPQAMAEINLILADLCAHVHWTVTGEDLESP